MSRVHMSRRRLIQGVGINDVTEPTIKNGIRPQSYVMWVGMLNRCYCESYLRKNPTYRGCTVCDEWTKFSAFKEWLEPRMFDGCQLDKDILHPGNRVYSPKKCLVVSRKVNSMVNIGSGGKYGAGVKKRYGRYVAKCGVDGETRHIGIFDTALEAKDSYLKFKSKVIMDYALSMKDCETKGALINFSKYLLMNADGKLSI